ncbi:MAG TPA: hypothetical protein VI874_01085 [Candidatus Norongarragalinales archaeon]|nr:hypothetical protein [Candidatus Norongarragalinales archaeon]
MIKKYKARVAFLLLALAFSVAADAGIDEGKRLVESKVACDALLDNQLEAIGDYYMEQMHPGPAHEFMDDMMGGEGSESLKRVHLNIVKRLYCNENVYVGYASYMGSMMGGYFGQTPGTATGNTPYGMMNGYGWNGWGFGLNGLLLTLLLVGLVVSVFLWILKLWQDLHPKNKSHGGPK